MTCSIIAFFPHVRTMLGFCKMVFYELECKIQYTCTQSEMKEQMHMFHMNFFKAQIKVNMLESYKRCWSLNLRRITAIQVQAPIFHSWYGQVPNKLCWWIVISGMFSFETSSWLSLLSYHKDTQYINNNIASFIKHLNLV